MEKARELQEGRASMAQVLTELRISEARLYQWQATYKLMTKSEAKELQCLRDENSCLKRLLGQAKL
ncbi:transposase [Arcanobacterium phocae]